VSVTNWIGLGLLRCHAPGVGAACRCLVVLLHGGPLPVGGSWGTPDTYQMAGIRRGTATSKDPRRPGQPRRRTREQCQGTRALRGRRNTPAARLALRLRLARSDRLCGVRVELVPARGRPVANWPCLCRRCRWTWPRAARLLRGAGPEQRREGDRPGLCPSCSRRRHFRSPGVGLLVKLLCDVAVLSARDRDCDRSRRSRLCNWLDQAQTECDRRSFPLRSLDVGRLQRDGSRLLSLSLVRADGVARWQRAVRFRAGRVVEVCFHLRASPRTASSTRGQSSQGGSGRLHLGS